MILLLLLLLALVIMIIFSTLGQGMPGVDIHTLTFYPFHPSISANEALWPAPNCPLTGCTSEGDALSKHYFHRLSLSRIIAALDLFILVEVKLFT